MGFAETGASGLRNNRNLLGSKRRMNDAHLKVGKYYKEKSANEKSRNKNKLSKDKLEKFKLEFKKKKKLENRKTVISLISLIVIATMIGLLFLTITK